MARRVRRRRRGGPHGGGAGVRQEEGYVVGVGVGGVRADNRRGGQRQRSRDGQGQGQGQGGPPYTYISRPVIKPGGEGHKVQTPECGCGAVLARRTTRGGGGGGACRVPSSPRCLRGLPRPDVAPETTTLPPRGVGGGRDDGDSDRHHRARGEGREGRRDGGARRAENEPGVHHLQRARSGAVQVREEEGRGRRQQPRRRSLPVPPDSPQAQRAGEGEGGAASGRSRSRGSTRAARSVPPRRRPAAARPERAPRTTTTTTTTTKSTTTGPDPNPGGRRSPRGRTATPACRRPASTPRPPASFRTP